MDYGNQKSVGYTALTAAGNSLKGDVEPDCTAVRDGVTLAEQLQSELSETVRALEQRLDTILRPVGPGTGGVTGNTPTPVRSHLAGRLDIYNDGMRSLLTHLNSIRTRIEL